MTSKKYIAGIILFTILSLSFTESSQDNFVDPRDSNTYKIIQINKLKWFGENLRYRSGSENDTLISIENCGVFYLFEDAKKACPEGWRLPTEQEVKELIKAEKKGEIDLIDTLNIDLCGRVDYEKHSKPGIQNTFWLNEELKEGHISHWHTFGDQQKTHSHDVINARRKFPVRCVCEIN